MSKLALFGGLKVRTKLFPAQKTIGIEEREAVLRVLESKKLSMFRGNYTENFYGGEEIQALEKECEQKFSIKKALAVNSCTSALYIGVGSIELKPGDEIIVTAFSMSCSATICMHYGAIPIFVDIEPKNFCLDPVKIEEKITDKTKAIIIVDLFGYIYDYEKINKLAKKYGLYVIEDAAQAIGSKINGRYAGTFGDISTFSFTQGKTLSSGEGGIIGVNNMDLYMKCALLRNHCDAVINDMPSNEQKKYKNFLYPGMNLRMTEIQAAILREQMKKLDYYVEYKNDNVRKLKEKIGSIPGIRLEESNFINSYYVLAFYYDEEEVGIPRNIFINAVKAELSGEEFRVDRGVPIGNGYIKPLFLFPIFQDKHNLNDYPVIKRMWEKELFITLLHCLALADEDIQDIYLAFRKVYENRKELL